MKKVYELIGLIGRKSLLLRKIFAKVGLYELIRKKNVSTIIKLNTGELYKINTLNWIGLQCFIYGSYDIEKKYEVKLLDIAKKIKSKCFLDIGTNHGYYSIKVANLLPDCKIYAFEPLSRNVEFIKENIRLNKLENIEIVKNVVSRERERVRVFYAGDENLGSSSCLNMFDTSDYEEVESLTIDDFVKNKNIFPDLVKIDVEGFELNVLEGMKNTLKYIRPILFIEHNCLTLSQNRVFIEDIVSFMKKYDYFPYDIDTKQEYKSSFGDRGLVLYIPSEKKELCFENINFNL